MRQKGFNPYRVGVSVQHQRPSSVAFTCPSWWGDTAQILNLTALLGAYGGPYGRFGTPAFGSITQNSLFCFVPGAEGKDEDDRLNTASMDFLPLFYDYPAVLDLHAYPCVRDPLDEATCQAGDVTTTAQTLYNQLQKTINDRGLALKEMLFGETFSAGQGCPDDTRAHQSVDGYRGNDIAASSDLYLQHSALTTFSMWYVPFYFSCKNPPDFIPTVNPPYNSKNR